MGRTSSSCAQLRASDTAPGSILSLGGDCQADKVFDVAAVTGQILPRAFRRQGFPHPGRSVDPPSAALDDFLGDVGAAGDMGGRLAGVRLQLQEQRFLALLPQQALEKFTGKGRLAWVPPFRTPMLAVKRDR